jgi:hypothetical protein
MGSDDVDGMETGAGSIMGLLFQFRVQSRRAKNSLTWR